MNILEFIFAVLVLIFLFLLIVGGIGVYFDVVKLEKENEKLKNDLKKARSRYLKREYKKAKDIKKEEEK